MLREKEKEKEKVGGLSSQHRRWCVCGARNAVVVSPGLHFSVVIRAGFKCLYSPRERFTGSVLISTQWWKKMFGIHVSANPLSLPFITLPRNPPNTRSKTLLRLTPNSASTEDTPTSSQLKTPFALVLSIPKTIWRQTLRPLSDFGFGRKSIWEGGVGLFLLSGALLLALSLVWLRGFYFRSRLRKYQAVFQFSQACGMCTGTPVRIRGVTVGNVIRIVPSLKAIEAVVEVEDEKVIIPQNSLIEVNQSGLLMETMIDITPQDPLPKPSVGPLDTDCIKEGLIVCDRQRIRGHQGISLDALVGIFTRLGREMEEIGVARSYKLAERVASVIQEAKPLIAMIEAMAEDVQPLLAEVRDSGLLKEVESLTKSLTEITTDLRTLNTSIMTPENTEQIRRSIYSFVFTLKNIESISSDISTFTGDENTRRNLKLLIKSLSRLL